MAERVPKNAGMVAAAARVAGGGSGYLATPPATRALPLRVRGGYNHERHDHQPVVALRVPEIFPLGPLPPGPRGAARWHGGGPAPRRARGPAMLRQGGFAP
ncbi:MAG: hypothetical protein WCR06_03285 [bacterium]